MLLVAAENTHYPTRLGEQITRQGAEKINAVHFSARSRRDICFAAYTKFHLDDTCTEIVTVDAQNARSVVAQEMPTEFA